MGRAVQYWLLHPGPWDVNKVKRLLCGTLAPTFTHQLSPQCDQHVRSMHSSSHKHPLRLHAELKRQLLSRRLVNSSDILGGTHCLAPACIRASLAASLAKLRIETLDLLYLHNPAEVQLEARGKQKFFEVLRAAFKVGAGSGWFVSWMRVATKGHVLECQFCCRATRQLHSCESSPAVAVTAGAGGQSAASPAHLQLYSPNK